jgi:glycosyltransferase involved in cell wall biosynthesis
MATRDRSDILTRSALPCVRRQTRPPELVVIVNDGGPFSGNTHDAIRKALSPIPIAIIESTGGTGVAAAWNRGLQYLLSLHFKDFVAILDDDDLWEDDHLSSSIATAAEAEANVVVSGLRAQIDGETAERALIRSLSFRQFLVGNPGWQGSNTFVHMDMFRAVGGFRNGLLSANDRDLAIRLLRDKRCRIGFTERWTATWRLQTAGHQISSVGSHEKLAGLRWFWHLYGSWMTEEESGVFFGRATQLFGIGERVIVQPGNDLPGHRRMLGDLDG